MAADPTPATRPKVTAVVCTIARPAGLQACVASILASEYPSLEVVVVDQDLTGASGEAIAPMLERDPRLRRLFTPVPGKTRAQNLAVAGSDADVFVFTDDDCVVPGDWVERIVAAFEQSPDAGMLYGQVLEPAGDAGGEFVPALHIAHAERLSKDGEMRIYGMGCDMAVQRSLFDRIGLFDEVLGVGGPLKGSGEDFDFQYRALTGGATVLLRPEITVDHYGGRDLRQWQSDLYVYGRGDGAFYLKHIRCRDLRALRMWAVWAGRGAVRELLVRLHLWHGTSNWRYIKGFWSGMRDSRRFRVDRRSRLYVKPADRAPAAPAAG